MTEAKRLSGLLRAESDRTSLGVRYSTAKNASKELDRLDAELAASQAEVARLRDALEKIANMTAYPAAYRSARESLK